jgi:hypothetical protein
MTVQNRFFKQLGAPAKDRPVLDMFSSTAEAIVDIMTKDDLISAVPFASTAFKTVKALDTYRDRVFAEKLQAFVSGVETLSSEQRSEMARKFTADDEGRKAGETLLLVLDKLTDMDKPALLGLLLKGFGEAQVTSLELRRLASAIDVAFAEDLVEFFNESDVEVERENYMPHRIALFATGLTQAQSSAAIGGGEITYFLTPLGKLLHKVVQISRT